MFKNYSLKWRWPAVDIYQPQNNKGDIHHFHRHCGEQLFQYRLETEN